MKCFVCSSIAFDFREVQQGFIRCKQSLGDETVRMMARRESEGTADHPEYQAAVTILLYRHMCRMETWPEPVQRALGNIGMGPLSQMFGPHLFNCTGTLRTYDRMGDLHRVTTPVLIVDSEHDYVLPELCAVSCQYLPEFRVRILPRLQPHAVLGEPGRLPRRRRRLPRQASIRGHLLVSSTLGPP